MPNTKSTQVQRTTPQIVFNDRIQRIDVTPSAAGVIKRLKQQHGALMFHLSGGCCDGSSPMCFMLSEFKIGQQDIQLGTIEDCPFYMPLDQFERWQHTHLTVDVCEGRGASFSLEIPLGVRFVIKSNLLETRH